MNNCIVDLEFISARVYNRTFVVYVCLFNMLLRFHLPRIMLPLRRHGTIGEGNPRALAIDLGLALLVLADPRLFLLEDKVDA